MKKNVSIFVVMILCLALFAAGCGKDRPAGSADPKDTDAAESFVTISTPYAELKAPASYEDHVTTTVESEDPYTLCFKSAADDAVLFRLIFGGEGGDLLGTLVGEDANTVVYVDMPELDRESEHFEENAAYQEDFGTIVENLRQDYVFAVNQAIEQEDTSTFVIHTSLTDLYYPNRWKDVAQIETSDDGVKFSKDGTLVFELRFAECDGFLLGTYNGTPIYIIEHDLSGQEQADMADDVNVILEHLKEDANFSMNH